MVRTLQEMIEDRETLRVVGRVRCGRCLKTYELPSNQAHAKRMICNECFAFDENRRREAESAVCGGLSSSPEFELSTVCNPDTEGRVVIRGPRAIGLRSDARWYKKAGGNGDG